MAPCFLWLLHPLKRARAGEGFVGGGGGGGGTGGQELCYMILRVLLSLCLLGLSSLSQTMYPFNEALVIRLVFA